MDLSKDYRLQGAAIILLIAVLSTMALVYTKPVLVPFVISLFLYAAFTPAINLVRQKLKFPNWAAVLMTMLISGMVIFFTLIMISNSLHEFIKGLEVYRDRLVSLVEWGSFELKARGVEVDTFTMLKELRNLPILKTAQQFTGGVLNFVGNAFLILIFLLFLLLGESRNKEHGLLVEIQGKVSRYVTTKFLTSMSTGLIVGVILGVLKVDLAFMLAILTLLLNFIPSIGSIIATFLPLPIIIIQYGLGWQFYAALVLIGATQVVIGNIIEPKFMGEAMDLHPVTIMVFLMFWGLVWGLPGMFMAVPITAILKIILSRLNSTKVLAEILAGRLPSSI